MAKIEKHEPGMFSWADLATSDPEAAKGFYQKLFGWTFVDQPAGPDRVYSMAQLDGESAAGLYRKEDDEQGIPPHWTCYFTVPDVERASQRCTEAGGTVLVPPLDVMEAGRMIVIRDPSEGVCALWQAKRHIGATVAGVHGSLCWAELLSRDLPPALAFYRALHGFEVDSMPTGMGEYTVCRVGERPSCGMMAMPEQVPAGVPSHWLPYFLVDDLDATLKLASEAGGQAQTPKLQVEGVGQFATLSDPQGAVFSVLQPPSSSSAS